MAESHLMIITFSGALFFGIVLITAAGKLRVSPIVLLLTGGILLGPGSMGIGLIEPSSLGDGLRVIIQLAVGLILFEGGLTLDFRGYRELSNEIRRALTMGVVITWLGAAACIKFIFGFPWTLCIVSGSLIIVTGPTVIGPLLKRIGVKKNIHSFLHWEGVLIDPVGVFIALLCYEWIIGEQAITLFFLRILLGVVIGSLSGIFLTVIIRKNWIAEENLNVFAVAYAVAVLTISDIIIPESGLLAVTLCGFITSFTDTPQIERLRTYKSQMVDMLIGLLFILLAANLDIDSFNQKYHIGLFISVLVVMFVIRPLNIFIPMLTSKRFTFREKLFLSWIAPRGIVAASMASIFTLKLSESSKIENSGFIEAFTYAVITGTVIFQGFTAKLVGRFLGVLEPVPTGWLIIGAHPVSLRVADFIQKNGFEAVLLDTNLRAITEARKKGYTALFGNAVKTDIDDYPELYGIGNVLAITVNEDLNQLACQHWKKILSSPGLYKWSSSKTTGESMDEILIGKSVWMDADLEELINNAVSKKKTVIYEKKIPDHKLSDKETVLMCVWKNRIYPYIPKDAEDEVTSLIAKTGNSELKPDFNTRPEWITFTDKKCMKDILAELIDLYTGDHPHIDKQRLHKKLVAMELEFSSVMGHGVAIPHTYIDGINESSVLVAVSGDGITCHDSDEDIRIIFLVLSPVDKPEEHIGILSDISKFIISEETRNRLLAGRTEEEIMKVFFPDKNQDKNKSYGS